MGGILFYIFHWFTTYISYIPYSLSLLLFNLTQKAYGNSNTKTAATLNNYIAVNFVPGPVPRALYLTSALQQNAFPRAWNAVNIVEGKGSVLPWCFLHVLILRFLPVTSSATSNPVDCSHCNEVLLSLNFSSSQYSTLRNFTGTSLVVHCLRLHAPSAGGLGSLPGQGTRSRMPQLKIPHATTKILCTATKTRCSQINK